MKLNKFIPVTVLFLALAGCGGKGTEESSKKPTKENATASTESKSHTVANTSSTSKSQSTKGEKEVEAAYIGQDDTSSIEVKTKTETLSLQVDGVKNVDWNSIEKGTPVSLNYYKDKNGQYVLKNIEVKTGKKAKVIKEDAAFVGQLDPNSIEVNTKTDKLVLQVDKVQNVDWNSIEPNSPVVIEYYKDGKTGQYILQSIEKK